MIASMTGFFEKSFDSPSLSLKISIRTLNHRFFDWNYRGFPLKELENRLRSLCQKKIHRGRIDVTFEIDFLDSSKWDIQINQELLGQILTALDKATKKVLADASLSIDNLFNIPHVVELRRKNLTDNETLFLEKCFGKVLEELVKVRRREGTELMRGIQVQTRKINQSLNVLEKLVKKQPDLIRKKMLERISDLGKDIPLSEEKLVEEAAFLAQKYDLSEEMARLRSHLQYFRQLLTSREKEPVGRQLDFVTQELYRETNTISSKSQDIAITKECLAIKGELEGVRQQIQNIE
jgi:uncharacterized protein (TIGR00255 family)